MKTFKSKLFAFAFVALGLTAGITSCSKNKTDDENADFSGTYYGAYDIVGILEIEDTIVIKNTGDDQIEVFSVKLDTSFTATVTGNKAIFDGFQAETFQSGNLILNDIDVKGGDGTLTNGTDLNVRLRSVSVGSLAGNVPDQLKDVEIKNINITTKRTFKKQP